VGHSQREEVAKQARLLLPAHSTGSELSAGNISVPRHVQSSIAARAKMFGMSFRASCTELQCCRSSSVRDLPGIWCRYVGHCNCATDIKEVTFLGSNDELVACSSDDGYVFIYESVRACVGPPSLLRQCGAVSVQSGAAARVT